MTRTDPIATWWRCHLCGQSHRTPTPADEWYAHYLADHFRAGQNGNGGGRGGV